MFRLFGPAVILSTAPESLQMQMQMQMQCRWHWQTGTVSHTAMFYLQVVVLRGCRGAHRYYHGANSTELEPGDSSTVLFQLRPFAVAASSIGYFANRIILFEGRQCPCCVCPNKMVNETSATLQSDQEETRCLILSNPWNMSSVKTAMKLKLRCVTTVLLLYTQAADRRHPGRSRQPRIQLGMARNIQRVAFDQLLLLRVPNKLGLHVGLVQPLACANMLVVNMSSRQGHYQHLQIGTCFEPLQAIQEAVLRSGVPQRLSLLSDAAAGAPGARANMRGSSASPRSTITLKADLEADQQFETPTAVRAPGAVQMRRSNRSEGDTEVGC